ncbi:hypothetical protein [uncultured Tateyamaria sp.]|uniref:hypothetical protein n=1 Tax=Tateyamaria sp. 1078 TaxID=3417464 RepID=UPI00263910EA|nr:hypothetical protein [uncultured Tateyamaria sp.]
MTTSNRNKLQEALAVANRLVSEGVSAEEDVDRLLEVTGEIFSRLPVLLHDEIEKFPGSSPGAFYVFAANGKLKLAREVFLIYFKEFSGDSQNEDAEKIEVFSDYISGCVECDIDKFLFPIMDAARKVKYPE